MRSDRPVLIAGAGIAGLATTLALARAGVGVHLLERRPEPTEIGAGIQLSPNGVKALWALGLRDTLDTIAFRPQALAMRRGRDGQRLASLPFGGSAEKRYGAPFLTLLRRDLQALLLAAVRQQAGIVVTNGFDLVRCNEVAGSVVAQAADGREVIGTALVAADGLWSTVAREAGGSPPIDASYAAYRAMLDAKQLPAPFDAPEVGLWIGPEAHVVHYPVAAGAQFNIVIIVAERGGSEGWDEPGRLADLSPHLAHWSRHLVGLVERVPQWRRWHLFERSGEPAWAAGNTLRIGDAAHPMLPFLAQGAVMALEDAVVLGALCTQADADWPTRFGRFVSLRQSRALRVAAAARSNGPTYHLTGSRALLRDLVLQWAPPARLLGRYDWIYDYDAGIAAPAARTPTMRGAVR